MSENKGNRASRSQVQVTVARNNWREVIVSEYINNQSGNIKQLSMNPWLTYYLPLALLNSDETTDSVILEAARESVCQLRAQIDSIVMALQIHGLDLPIGSAPTASASSSIGRQEAKKKTKIAKPAANDEPIEPTVKSINSHLIYNLND
jgi:hypothetical protein